MLASGKVLRSLVAPGHGRRTVVAMLVSLVLCLTGQSVRADHVGGANMPVTAHANTYVFATSQSTVVQTGGIAGVNETHPVDGWFRLLIDPDAGHASFSQVQAGLSGKSSFLPTRDLNVIFNMTGLVGTVGADGAIAFQGKTTDGTKTDVVMRLTFSGDSVGLTGQTIPPAGSADFFVYNLQAVAGRKYGGGTGEPNTPYLIGTAGQMNAIGVNPTDWDAHFKLMADLDLSDLTGTAFNIIGPNDATPFTGDFDGNGYVIANFSYASAGTNYTGLFGCVGWDGQISNLTLIAPSIDAGKGDYVGPLAGCLNGGAVSCCSCQGAVVSGRRYVAALVGQNTVSSGGILEILGVGTIDKSCAGGSVLGEQNVGGLVGANSGIITNCCSSAAASGTSDVGGLVGSNNKGPGPAEITNCYSTGAVVGTARAGGLVGHNSGEVTGSFWDVQTSGQAASAGGKGQTTAEMQTAATFLAAGWDLTDENANGTEDIWRVCESLGYPRLSWQVGAGDFVCPDGVTTDDFLFFAERWLTGGCDSSNDYCQGADLNLSGTVDTDDLAIFLEIWLAGL